MASAYPFYGTVYCFYQTKLDNNAYYACVIAKLIEQRNDLSASLKGNYNMDFYGYHKLNKTDFDVLEIEVLSSLVTNYPNYLNYKFKNLKTIRLTAGIENIKFSDFKDVSSLEELYLTSNHIKMIPSNTFIYNKNLKLVNLVGNPLNMIGI